MRPIIASMVLALLAARPALAEDWTGWYTLQDGYRAHVQVRALHLPNRNATGQGDVKFQFRNAYAGRASFEYEITNELGQRIGHGREELGAGATSWEGATVHRARLLYFTITKLHAAGSSTLMPAIN